MVEFTINENSFVTRSDISIIESCKFNGIQIPRFCYQESLSIAGNCRMCLIEIEDSEKFILAMACLTSVDFGLSILTNSLPVVKARENVIEALLLNHPLDCPICDQAGECDLQDQTKNYGNDSNKIFSKRRGVEDKNVGSVIKTIMTRCIHCTRCVRFFSEVVGVKNLGTLNRGNSTEIGSYISNYIESNISGNVVDLCPVGALTTKSHAYQTRPWELRVTETIDLTDSLGSNIFVNCKESEIIRILPKQNETNGNLISNKTRFSYDSLVNNRLYEKSNETILNWNDLLDKYNRTERDYIKLLIVINEQLNLKLINRLKFLNYINNQIKIRSLSRFNEYSNLNYLLNNSIELFDTNINNCSIIMGSNNGIENEVLNARIRVKTLNQNYFSFRTNQKYNSRKENFFMNLDINEILLFVEGKFINLSNLVLGVNAPQIIIGEDLKKRICTTSYVQSTLKSLNNKILNILIGLSANSEGFRFLGIRSVNSRDFLIANTFFMIDTNENNILNKIILKIKGSIYSFNSHFSSLTKQEFNVIPIASNYFEASGNYINLEQRFQKSQKVLSSIGHLTDIEVFIKETFSTRKIRFNYLNFLKKINAEQNKNFCKNNFIFSFYKKVAKVKLFNYAFNYPVKAYFQNTANTDNFVQNSYLLLFSSFLQLYNSYQNGRFDKKTFKG